MVIYPMKCDYCENEIVCGETYYGLEGKIYHHDCYSKRDEEFDKVVCPEYYKEYKRREKDLFENGNPIIYRIGKDGKPIFYYGYETMEEAEGNLERLNKSDKHNDWELGRVKLFISENRLYSQKLTEYLHKRRLIVKIKSYLRNRNAYKNAKCLNKNITK